jgi:DNA-binding MarR family transcriptional regulator
MAVPTPDQLAALGTAFETFARRYKLADALGSDKPLNELDKLVLYFVARHPGCGPTDVARDLAVPGTTISSATDRLVKRGLLERKRPEANRRAVALRLSAQGEARFAALQSAYHAMHLSMLEPLTPGERDTLITLMTKIVSHEN